MRSCLPGWLKRARLFAFVVAMTMITSFAWGASTDEPQNIKIGGAGYNTSTQEFWIEISARFGIATAGERAGFEISSNVRVIRTDENGQRIEVASVTGAAPVVMASGSGGSDFVPLVDQLIFWDRSGGAASGLVTLEISSHLQKNGRQVANAADIHTESGIDLGGGRTDPSPDISHIQPPATAAGAFLPWTAIISISVFLVVQRWLRKPSVS